MAVDAAEELRGIALRLKAAGEGGMMRRVSAAMRKQARPLVDDVHAAAAERLPHRGGLAARVARERVTVSVRTGVNTAGVRLLMRSHDATATNSGYVRHPTFGHEPWRRQKLPEARGWWSDTLRRRSGRIRAGVVEAMRQTAGDIMRGA